MAIAKEFSKQKMPKPRFIFFDLDATFLDDEKKIDEATLDYLQALQKRKGVHYGFSTGRHAISVTPYLEKHCLRGFFDGMVCNSGADIYGFRPPTHLACHYLSADTLTLILERFRAEKDIAVGFHCENKLVATRMNREVQTILQRNAYSRFYYPEEVPLRAVPKCILLFDSKDQPKLETMLQAQPFKGLHWVFTEPNICELLDERNTKAAGVKQYLRKYCLSAKDIMAFGDAENDRQILQEAGVSVCMKNGDERIKAIADYVTEKTNNENGVMDFLKKHEELL